jgi:hypothetical protein
VSGPTCSLPELALAPLQPPEPVQRVALVELHASVDVPFVEIEAAFAVNVTVGAGVDPAPLPVAPSVRPYCRRARRVLPWRMPTPDSSASRLKISIEPPPPDDPDAEAEAAAAGDDSDAGAVTATVAEFWVEPPSPVHVSM